MLYTGSEGCTSSKFLTFLTLFSLFLFLQVFIIRSKVSINERTPANTIDKLIRKTIILPTIRDLDGSSDAQRRIKLIKLMVNAIPFMMIVRM